MKKNINVVLVDDHPLIVMGSEYYINLEDDINVVGKATNGNDAIEIVNSKDVDVVLMDISMPGLNGLDAAEIIKDSHPDVKIVLITMYKNADYISRAKEIGVEGYVIKEDAPDVIINVIRTVYNGFINYRVGSSYIMTNTPTAILNLTMRETQVLRLISLGKTANEISDELIISPKTVNQHRYNIKKKLKIRSTAGFVRIAIQNNLIDINTKV